MSSHAYIAGLLEQSQVLDDEEDYCPECGQLWDGVHLQSR